MAQNIRPYCTTAQSTTAQINDSLKVGRHVLDLVVAGWLVVELKAVASLEQIHVVQVKSYLRAIGSNAGLLLNFGDVILDIKRVVVRFERRVGQAAAV